MIKNIKTKENEDIFINYFRWKELNQAIREHYTRGVNLHEYITENLCCILNGYILHAAEGGSEDAVDDKGNKIQIKGTSNFDDDLTSFGPTSEFDILEFVRLDQKEDKFYFYKIDINYLKNIYVNAKETFLMKQKTGQRPRFSIIKKIIVPKGLKPYAEIDMKTGVAEYY